MTLPIDRRAYWGVLLALVLALAAYSAAHRSAPLVELEPEPTVTVTVTAPGIAPTPSTRPSTTAPAAPVARHTAPSTAPPSRTATASPSSVPPATSSRPTAPTAPSTPSTPPPAPLPLTASIGVAIPTRSPVLALKAALAVPAPGAPPFPLGITADLTILGIQATAQVP